MKIEREFSAATRREQNKRVRRRAYRTFAAVVVGILLGAAGITALLGGGAVEENSSLVLEQSGTASTILAAVPMQGGSATTAEYGAVPLAEGEYTILSQSIETIRQPETGQVSLEYFADAAFLGDSLTVGFSDYSINLSGALICGYTGSSPNLIVNETVMTHSERGEEIPIEVLAEAQPSKVYLLLGTNTLVSTGNDESFLAYYSAMIDQLYAALGEDVILYVQSVPPATEAAVADGKEGLESSRLQSINESLAALAEEKGCVYLDLWEVFADEEGNLSAALAAADGIHFTAGDGYTTWVNYLRTHTVYDASNPWTSGSAFAG
ncbi:MAG: GDSL-type esterase/lipase family protein [Faecalibacterium sp.]